MKNPARVVEGVIRESDILLIVIDARDVEGSRSRWLESIIKRMGKRFLYVVNKCDLVDRKGQKRIPNSVRISARNRLGTLRLMRRIKSMAGKKSAVVGVVGYPNTGKSTLINILKGKKSASTSPAAGHTRGMQKLRISSRIMMIDTPGLIPLGRERAGHAAIGAVDPERIEDPEMVAAEIIETMKGRIERYFGVEGRDDSIETLQSIAEKKKILKKGGGPDTKRMAKHIIRLCQRGAI